jgi:hypothetical protein
MVEFTFQGRLEVIASLDELDSALDEFDGEKQFELWASVPDGPAMGMLRSGENAWLMYLRHEGDSGFNSLGNPARLGVAGYTLANGQVDEYPLSWCIEVEQCYKAVSYFFVNEGAKPEWVTWHES